MVVDFSPPCCRITDERFLDVRQSMEFRSASEEANGLIKTPKFQLARTVKTEVGQQ